MQASLEKANDFNLQTQMEYLQDLKQYGKSRISYANGLIIENMCQEGFVSM